MLVASKYIMISTCIHYKINTTKSSNHLSPSPYKAIMDHTSNAKWHDLAQYI